MVNEKEIENINNDERSGSNLCDENEKKKRKVGVITLAVLCILILWVIVSGFSIQTSAYITDDFVVSEDGSKITFKVDVGASMGYVRGYKDVKGVRLFSMLTLAFLQLGIITYSK